MIYKLAIFQVIKASFPDATIYMNLQRDILIIGVSKRSQKIFRVTLQDYVRQNFNGLEVEVFYEVESLEGWAILNEDDCAN